MIPLKDENPTRATPVVTLGLIGVCVAVYFFVQPTGKAVFSTRSVSSQQDTEFTYAHAAIPFELVHGRQVTCADLARSDSPVQCSIPVDRSPFAHKNVYLAVLYSMFLHGSLLHIGGNMLFLWVFGNNIEDSRGRVEYLVFYLLSGLAATGLYVALNPGSTVPMIGASGAIAGVMGAYLVLYPHVRIRSLVFLGFFVLFPRIPAWFFLVFWFVTQFFVSPSSGVASMAHVGGFAFGVLAGLAWRSSTRPPGAVRPTGYGPYGPY